MMPGWLRVRVDPLDPLFRPHLVEALESEGFEVHTEQEMDVKNADVVVKVVAAEGGMVSALVIARALNRFRERSKIGSRVVVMEAEASNIACQLKAD
jgi:hypothetical protein